MELTICQRLAVISIPLPLNKFRICPRPKVTLEMRTAVFTFSFARALNKKPLKMTSSRKPTQSMLRI